MPFDGELIEAQLAYGSIRPRELAGIACDALEAGFDGPGLRRLSALEEPSACHADRFLQAATAEMGLEQIDVKRASIRLAQRLARNILHGDQDPLPRMYEFFVFWMRSDFCAELATVGSFDDEKGWLTYSTTMREEALMLLRKFAELEIG